MKVWKKVHWKKNTVMFINFGGSVIFKFCVFYMLELYFVVYSSLREDNSLIHRRDCKIKYELETNPCR